jgi:hypothetical protein
MSTWMQTGRHSVATVEGRDGVPDFVVARDRKTGRWHVSGRTSAHWQERTHATLDEAKAHVEPRPHPAAAAAP